VSKLRRKPSQIQRTARSGQSAPNAADWLPDLAIYASLLLATFAVYAQVSHFEFVTIDDGPYVYANSRVQAGLTIANIKYALTQPVGAHWAPVTVLSHMLDCELFGLESGMHHLVNVFIHMLSAVILFATLRRATGARWCSAFVAFVFALHPLHVESVAWIAERKDVLSAFFLFLALYAYVRYTEAPGLPRYLMVMALFCLGLMSKATLVTLPFVLLFFDLWPLHRTLSPKLLWEKAPFAALSAGNSVATYFAQHSAILSIVPLNRRTANAMISYVVYIEKMFWPTRLAWFYNYRNSIAAWQVAGSVAILAAISTAAILTWRTRPYFISGWVWYLGFLLPVIGFVQAGMQSHADRFTYIPMVGLLWILAWGAADVLEKWPGTKAAIVSAAVVGCLVCPALTWEQVGYWQNSGTLYQHAIDVTEDSRWSRRNLADYQYELANRLMEAGRDSEAVAHFEAVLRAKPDYPEAYTNLGIILAKMGRPADAIAHFEAALSLNPNLAPAHRNLGMLLRSIPGKEKEAIGHLEAAQRIQPAPELLPMIERLKEKVHP
jgi:tetratricopeptide (TPR) repeat protein